MEDENREEVFENEEEEVNVGDNIEDSSAPESEDSGEGISREDFVDAFRDLIEEESTEEGEEENENDIEGDHLGNNELDPQSSLQTDQIDYTEILEQILEELEAESLARQAQQELEAQTIFDKPLNEFTVAEGIGAIGICFSICAIIIVAIKHFTFDLWN